MTPDIPLPTNLFHLRHLARALWQGWRGPLRPLLKPTVWKIALAFAIVPLLMNVLVYGVTRYLPTIPNGAWQTMFALSVVLNVLWPAAVVAWATRLLFRRVWEEDAQVRLLPISPDHRLASVLGTLVLAYLLQAAAVAVLAMPLVLFQGSLPIENPGAKVAFHLGQVVLQALEVTDALEHALTLLVASLAVLTYLAKASHPTLPQAILAALAPVLAVKAMQFLLFDLSLEPVLLKAFGPFFSSPRMPLEFSVQDVLHFQGPYLAFRGTRGVLSLLGTWELLQLAFYPRLLVRARHAFTSGDAA